MTWPGGGQDQQGQQPQQWGQPAPQQQQQQPQYGGFGQGGYGGLGAFDQKPQKKKGKHTKAILFSGLGVVLVAAVVVTVVLLTNGKSPQAAPTPPPGPTTSSKEIAKPPEPVREAAKNPGWQVVANSITKLMYEVPPAWKPSAPADKREMLGNPGISNLSKLGSYQCGGGTYSRGVTGMVALKPKEGGPALETGTIAADYAKGFANSFYRFTKDGKTQTPQVALGQPKPVQRQGVNGVVVEATATTAPGEPCMAASGKVIAIVHLLKEDSAIVMVANADTAAVAGQESAPTATDDELNKIVDSFRVATQ
ncbi:hypothetical protein [Allokutzneria sp. NRRL B-24872]|uniref:hypothetical protein n=1 Tax=Allokutzneria sp. NRRL B-24872 TaxID=1137961 RepID=UPI000A38D1AA|nr:hypothetical protein [Allokutzneria sp. NRRL B-24872]